VPRYAAFLRGINVGGHRVTTEELCSAFAELGFDGAATFRASGNVVFDADGARPDALAAVIEEGLGRSLGYAVPAFVRTAAQVRALATAQPFDPELVESGGKLQVVLLRAKPRPAALEKVLAMATDEDRLASEGAELLWLPSGGLMESQLDLDALAGVVGPTTVRTKGTIEQMAAKFFV
jgi:uncharacterized protein (DUF1697 family)